jgi:RNA polymerase sigma-70 factor (ECF subfamily)
MSMEEQSALFYKLIWPHAATLLRVAQVLCRNHAEAEDLVQETLLKAFRHLEQFQEGQEGQEGQQGNGARRWLMTILRNTRIDRIRSQAGKTALSLDQAEIDPPAEEAAIDLSGAWTDPTALLESLSDQQMIDALLQLPEEIRWSLLLVDVEGLEMADAAEVMAIPTGTVKSRLFRGRRMLRERLEKSGGAS